MTKMGRKLRVDEYMDDDGRIRRVERMDIDTIRALNRAWDDIKNNRVYNEEQWKEVRKRYDIG